MKTSRFWGYFGKVGLGAGVAVALGGAPIVAHADDSEPLPAIEVGSEATQNAATKASSPADQGGSAATGAAEKAGNEASGAAQKSGDEASGAADKANSATTGAADKASGATDDSSKTGGQGKAGQ